MVENIESQLAPAMRNLDEELGTHYRLDRIEKRLERMEELFNEIHSLLNIEFRAKIKGGE